MIIITTCTNKKKVPVEERLEAKYFKKGTLKGTASVWREQIQSHRPKIKAVDMYSGRAFLEARKANELAKGNLWIISAGLGLISSDEEIPGYDLTISPGSPNSIRELVNDTEFSLPLWWSEVNRLRRPKRSIAKLVSENPNELIIITASSAYFQLIQEDLLSLDNSQLNQLRIIGCDKSPIIDKRLTKNIMPYGDKLDSNQSPIQGTKSDLPQRALYHFVSEILLKRPKSSKAKHADLVISKLENLQPNVIPNREKKSDEEIIILIRKYWDDADGKSADMLKLLRRKKNIACEQSRFSRLFKIAKKARTKAGSYHAKYVTLRAVKTTQGNDVDVFSFFIPGNLIMKIADISRIHRDDKDELEGFQRTEIKRHVNSIVEYLNQKNILFPNSITLAFSPDVDFKFKSARGRDPEGTIENIHSGTLNIPLLDEGERVAWIVDGQQRSLALAKSENQNLNVPVVAFVASDLNTQREQFILVNKARPLPTRLINELLPEVDTHLPKDLSVRKIPSGLCTILNQDPDSPFCGLIKQLSRADLDSAVITDTAIVDMIKASLNSPLGILAQYKGIGSDSSNTEQMRKILIMYWNIVKKTFPDAWALPPQESRLMHSAGIKAMGTLMDKIMVRALTTKSPEKHVKESLERIAPHCCWTDGVWDHIGIPWSEIQQTTRHVRLLSDVLTKLDYEMTIQRALL